MSVSPSTIRPALRTWAVCCVLFAGTVLLFLRAAGYGFINYDDPRYVTSNPFVQAGFTWDSIVWAFTAPEANWHPLTWFSHMLDWQLFGDSATGHHLVSIGWHALNAVLVFLLFRRLTGFFWTSAFAAALFAWHPLRVESVAWVAERKDVLSGCFFLLTLLAYNAYAERRRAALPAGRIYGLALVCFGAGLMSKPMVVSLPVVLLILDFWPLRRLTLEKWDWPQWRGLLWEKIPFIALALAGCVATVLLQHQSGAFTLPLPLDARIGNALVAVPRYLRNFFWPAGLTVAYPHPGYWPAWQVIAAALLITAVSLVAWRQRFVRPWLLAGWAWFLITLLPVVGLVQVGFQSMADRYTYLPLLGVQLALLWTLRDLPARWLPRGAVVAAAAVLVACGGRTWNQQAVWRDPVTLFQHALAVTERNEIAEGFLAYTHSVLGHLSAAEHHAHRALQFNPRNQTALVTLGKVRFKQLKFAEAAAAYRAVVDLNPHDTQSEFRLGLCLLQLGQRDEALVRLKSATAQQTDLQVSNLKLALAETFQGNPQNAVVHYEVALAFAPENAEVQFGAGVALARCGRSDDALARYQAALQLKPDHPGAQAEIGLLQLERRQPAEAAAHFRAALAARPDFGLAHLGLGRAAEQLGLAAEADASFARAGELMSDNPEVFMAWGEMLARRGQFAAAIPPYERAVQLQPANADTHAGLGFVLFLAQRRAEAISRWEEALRLNPHFPGLRERLQRVRRENSGR